MASNPKVPAFVFAQAARDAHALATSTVRDIVKNTKLIQNVGAEGVDVLKTRDVVAFDAGYVAAMMEVLECLPNPADGNPIKKLETKKKE